MKTTFVALADDHSLIRNGLANLIDTFDGFKVIFQAGNGQELIDTLKPKSLPDIVLMDINMPKKDGYDTTRWLRDMYPDIKVLALSMYDNESAVIRMIKNGACGYILKDAEPSDLRRALNEIVQKGYYHSELVTNQLVKIIRQGGSDDDDKMPAQKLNDKEIEFLKHACTELTYKEIADKMFLSPRTIDGYRDALFEKLKAKTRVGLVLYAIKNGIVNVE
jgi:two-component system invasion response regulator UvrY